MTVPNLFGGSSAGSSGVPNLFGSTSGGTSTGLDQLMAQIAAANGGQPQEEGFTPWGFVGNLLGGVADLGKGVAGLIGAGAHDVAMLVPQALGGDPEFKLDDIGKALAGFTDHGFHPTESVIAKDLGERYGMLAPGGRPASQIMQSLYDNPLAFALDAATVAGGAGAAAKAAGISSLGGRAALSEATNALKLLETGGEAAAGVAAPTGALGEAASAILKLKNAAGVSSRAAEAAGVRTGLDALAAGGDASLGQALKFLLPKETTRVMEAGKGVAMTVPGTEAVNPFNRVFTTAARRFTTEPIDKLATHVDDLRNQALASPSGDLASGELAMKEDLLAQAQAAGLSRIDVPFLRKTVYPKVMAMRIEREVSAASLNARNAAQKEAHDILVGNLADDPLASDVYHITSTGQQVALDGFRPLQWVTDRFGSRSGTQTLAVGERAGVVDTVLPDTVRSALEGQPMLARTDALVDDLTQLKSEFQTNPTLAEWDVASQTGAIDRMIRQLHDGLTRRVEMMRSGNVENDVRAMDEMRVLDMETRLPKLQSLETNPVSFMDRVYGSLKAKYEDELVPDPAALKPAEDGAVMLDTAPRGIDTLALDDAFHDAGVAQPTYFPYIEKAGRKGGDFFPVKRMAGANLLSHDASENRFMATLLKEDNYLTNPVSAFAQRNARRVREVNTYESFSTRIKRMGRIVTSKETLPEGWVAVSPDAIFLKHRIHLDYANKVQDYRMGGMSADDAAASALHDVMSQTQRDLSKTLAAKEPVMYAIPKVLADEMGAAAKWAKVGSPTWVKAAYDPLMNTWRSLVLTGSPRWVVNNVLGNTVMGMMQGVKMADVVRIFSERFRAMISTWAKGRGYDLEGLIGPTELRANSLAGRIEAMPGEGALGSGFFGKGSLESYKPNLGRDAEQTRIGRFVTNARTPGTKTNATLSLPRKWSESVRTLNGEIEASYRQASFLSAVEKQQGISAIRRTGRSFWSSKERMDKVMRAGYSEADATAAIAEVNHFFGNYTALGPFERHIVRKWFMPFWAFYKHTAKLMLTFPFQYPGRTQVLRAMSEATQEMVKEYGPMPEWLQSAIPLSPPGGEVSFLRTTGANPFQGLFQDPTQMLSPLLKVALEQFQGKDQFTGENFTDRNTFTPFGSDQAYATNQIDPVTGMPMPVAAPRPGILEHLLSQVPQYDMLKRAMVGGVPYDTSTILDAVQGNGAVLDTDPASPTYGQPKYPQDWMQQLQKLSGFNVAPYDLAGYQENLTSEQMQALSEALKRLLAEQAGASA